jgi:magnesium-transporting ATPase (P-type)
MDVLCVDKTGPITTNQLAVTGLTALDCGTETYVLLAGARVSQEANQDQIDPPFLASARKRYIFDAVPAVTALSFNPFDKLMVTFAHRSRWHLSGESWK